MCARCRNAPEAPTQCMPAHPQRPSCYPQPYTHARANAPKSFSRTKLIVPPAQPPAPLQLESTTPARTRDTRTGGRRECTRSHGPLGGGCKGKCCCSAPAYTTRRCIVLGLFAGATAGPFEVIQNKRSELPPWPRPRYSLSTSLTHILGPCMGCGSWLRLCLCVRDVGVTVLVCLCLRVSD